MKHAKGLPTAEYLHRKGKLVVDRINHKEYILKGSRYFVGFMSKSERYGIPEPTWVVYKKEREPEGEMKHTPGPWKVEFQQIDVGRAIQDRRVFIQINDGCQGLEETQANALLIAAAPDMLEALKGLYWEIHDLGLENKLSTQSIIEADMAIAKAEGRGK